MAGARAGHRSIDRGGSMGLVLRDRRRRSSATTSPDQYCVDREAAKCNFATRGLATGPGTLAPIGGAMGQRIPLIWPRLFDDGSMMAGAGEARLTSQRAAPTDSASPRARSARREPIITRRSSALTRLSIVRHMQQDRTRNRAARSLAPGASTEPAAAVERDYC
jgi:hypothetical protein